jgi:hypothetical protein
LQTISARAFSALPTQLWVREKESETCRDSSRIPPRCALQEHHPSRADTRFGAREP